MHISLTLWRVANLKLSLAHSFLGATMGIAPGGWVDGLLYLTAIFAPSFLLVLGALPFWHHQ